MIHKTKTIICDIDGTMLKHYHSMIEAIRREPEVLPGVLEAFKQWELEGHRIVLMTGRRESAREVTKRQLQSLGLFYDELLMGMGSGERILINDRGQAGVNTAHAVNLDCNAGFVGYDWKGVGLDF